jgi:hypothetical protein
VRPLVCLAGTLAPFRGAAQDVLLRFGGIRLGASTVRRASEEAGAALATRQRQGGVVAPAPAVAWDFSIEGHGHTAAYLGLDAFSVPIQGPGGAKADHRMIYTAVLYTPDKSASHYLVDFELDSLAAQMRQAAIKLGLGRASQLVALTDGGNGLQEALRRNFESDLTCILDWYHASEHLHAYSKAAHGEGQPAAAWAEEAKAVLYEEGGTALLRHLHSQAIPGAAEAAEEYRKLVGYFQGNEHRTDYPSYRSHGWDIGSGPTEAACKIVGARLKGSGMRWAERGAAEVAPLRALYHSGSRAWDAFFALST